MMNGHFPIVPLDRVVKQRKQFIQIDDMQMYKRCRVQLHAQGIVLRDIVTGAEVKTKQQQVCQSGEFLVAEIDAKVGGFGVIPQELDGAIVSSHYFLFGINDDLLDRRFLDYYIRTRAFRDQVSAQGSTNYAAIRPKDVLGYTIPLPPLAEQRRIVARIEELAAKIAEARGLRREAVVEGEAFWASALATTFNPELRNNGHSVETARDLLLRQSEMYKFASRDNYNNAHPWEPTLLNQGPYDLPASWEWTTLGSVLTHLVDCVNDTPDFAVEDTRLIGLKSTNIKPYKLDLSQKWYMAEEDFHYWNRREEPKAGDIVLTREAPMGHACMLPEKLDVCLTQRLMLLRSDDNFVDRKYVLHFLNSSHFKEQVLEHCRGLTTPHLRVGDAPNIAVPLASIPEQRRIVAYLDALQAKVDALKALQAETAAELDALLPAVLDKAFKGELY